MATITTKWGPLAPGFWPAILFRIFLKIPVYGLFVIVVVRDSIVYLRKVQVGELSNQLFR